MRILFIAPRFHTNQYQLVKTLLEENHQVFFHVAAIGTTEDHSLLIPTRHKQSQLSLLIEKFRGKGGLNRKYYFPAFINYYKEFSRLKPDIVIIRNPYRYFSILAAFYSLLTKSNIVFYTLEELFMQRSKQAIRKKNATIRLFNAAWMTPILGNESKQYDKVEHMYYVPLPIRLSTQIETDKEISSEGPKILMIGKYHQERKKHFLLVEAINTLVKKYNFTVTIVGECVRESQLEKFEILQSSIDKMGLRDIIELRKDVPFSEMEEIYTTHHAFALPAVNEPYGVSVTEALGYGLPVICTDTCGAKFNIRNGENGYVVKSNSLEEFTVALETFVSSKEAIREMSIKCASYVQNNLSASAFYSRFLYMINDRFHLQCVKDDKLVAC